MSTTQPPILDLHHVGLARERAGLAFEEEEILAFDEYLVLLLALLGGMSTFDSGMLVGWGLPSEVTRRMKSSRTISQIVSRFPGIV